MPTETDDKAWRVPPSIDVVFEIIEELEQEVDDLKKEIALQRAYMRKHLSEKQLRAFGLNPDGD